MNTQPFRAGVVGANGYTGRELVRLITGHPQMALAFATSESGASEPVPGTELEYVRAGECDPGAADIVFTCLPAGESCAWALKARSAGAAVVDLSADLRAGYGGAVYGLPELWREEVRGAALVANPGCYATGALLALAPAVRAGVVAKSGPIVINAASGVTGAGRTPRRELLFGEVAEDYRAYGVGNRHRHVAEVAEGLNRIGGGGAPFIFTPHLLPVRRGILETIHIPLTYGVTPADAVAAWAAGYESEPFIDVWTDGVRAGWEEAPRLPSLGSAAGGNRVVLGFSAVRNVEPPALLVTAALDNLLKGAAGQAIQNANLMLGLEEIEGLGQ